MVQNDQNICDKAHPRRFQILPGGRKLEMLCPPKIPNRPMIKLHIDDLCPFPRNTSGKMNILVVVDIFPRLVQLKAPKSSLGDKTVTKINLIIDDIESFFNKSIHFIKFCELLAAQFSLASGIIKM